MRNRQVTTSPNHHMRGFTLIELLVVMSIMMILASTALPQYRNAIVRAKEAVLAEDLFRMRDAIDQYSADKGKYPDSLDALVTAGYLRRLPEDPFTKSAGTWQIVPADPDPSNPGDTGVYNVLSGFDGVSLEGRKYSEL